MKKLIIILHIILTINCFAIERYVINCNRYLLLASRDSLYTQVGVKEKTNRNDGEKIEEYLKSVGRKRGDAYCAAGQYWCFLMASRDIKLSKEDIPIKKTGVAIEMYNDAKKRGIKTKLKLDIDDLIFWKRRDSWRGHVERIIQVKEAGWILTIGFNTSSGDIGSQDDGGGVYKRKRNIHHFLGRMVVRGLIGFKL